jgi:DNA ligase-1
MGDQPFEERIAHARKLFGKGGAHASLHRIKVVEQEEVKDRQHVLDKLKEVETLGGEGLMLRKPKSYVYTRTRLDVG